MGTQPKLFSRLLGLADLHLTSAESDSYRWLLFDWALATIKKEEITDVLLCGDISDFKDNHSAEYVNMLVQNLANLATGARVHWLMGNHDMIKEESPYFEFITKMNNLYYYKEPTFFEEVGICFLPYTKRPEIEWQDIDLSDLHLIFMHQPVIGAKSSDHYELTHGLSPTYFSDHHPEFEGQVFSGDIHIPQTVGDVTYFGAPYNIRFGDKVDGGGLLFTLEGLGSAGDGDGILFNSNDAGFSVEELHYTSMVKWHARIDTPYELEYYADKVNKAEIQDQMRVTVNFSTEAYTEWHSWKDLIRKYCTDTLKVKLGSVVLDSRQADFESIDREGVTEGRLDTTNPITVLEAYCKREEVGDALIAVGKKIIEDARQ